MKSNTDYEIRFDLELEGKRRPVEKMLGRVRSLSLLTMSEALEEDARFWLQFGLRPAIRVPRKFTPSWLAGRIEPLISKLKTQREREPGTDTGATAAYFLLTQLQHSVGANLRAGSGDEDQAQKHADMAIEARSRHRSVREFERQCLDDEAEKSKAIAKARTTGSKGGRERGNRAEDRHQRWRKQFNVLRSQYPNRSDSSICAEIARNNRPPMKGKSVQRALQRLKKRQ